MLVVIIVVKVKEVVFVIKELFVLIPHSPLLLLFTSSSCRGVKGTGSVTCCFSIHFYFRIYNWILCKRHIHSVKIIIHGSKSSLWLMILLQIELLHLKDLFMEIILCGRVSFEMIKSLHESLSERRNLPFWEVIKEFFYVWWEANSRLPINSELICLIFIDLVILLILNNDFLMHLRQMKLNQIFFSDGLHICWVHNYQLFSFVRLCDYLHRSVADHLVLKEL